jgi:hypothetical protein
LNGSSTKNPHYARACLRPVGADFRQRKIAFRELCPTAVHAIENVHDDIQGLFRACHLFLVQLDVHDAEQPPQPGISHGLTTQYYVDVFCGVFPAKQQHGVTLSPRLHRLLADRNLYVALDIYSLSAADDPA